MSATRVHTQFCPAADAFRFEINILVIVDGYRRIRPFFLQRLKQQVLELFIFFLGDESEQIVVREIGDRK